MSSEGYIEWKSEHKHPPHIINENIQTFTLQMFVFVVIPVIQEMFKFSE